MIRHSICTKCRDARQREMLRCLIVRSIDPAGASRRDSYEIAIDYLYMEIVMKGRMFLTGLLILVGSYANAATVLVGNGISWTTTITGVGTNTGTITLNADVSGASFGWGTDGYLAGIGIKDIADPNANFNITSVSLPDWSFNNYELSSGAGGACSGGGTTHRACAFADDADARIASADGNLSIVLGVTLDSGVLTNGYHFKVLWQNFDGSKTGSLISDDLSQVPLPAALWLFGSALIGLTVVARRRDRKQTAV